EILMGIPYPAAAGLLVAVTALYTYRGGFRAVASTDALQLFVMAAGAAVAFAAVLSMAGGPPEAGERLLLSSPAHLSRDGAGPGLGLGPLLGLWLLWGLADPLFPQLFQRFYAARDDESLRRVAVYYPVVCGILFFLTVGVGVTGAALLPGLAAGESEQIFPRLAVAFSRPFASAAFALAAAAALMSTMDSQLLTLSSMIVQDFFPRRSRSRGIDGAMIAALALLSWLAALSPPVLILDTLTGIAFPAYAALAPAVWAGLYGRRVDARGITAATGLGLALVGLDAADLVSFGPVPAAAAVLAAQVIVLLALRTPIPPGSPPALAPSIRVTFGTRWLAGIACLAGLATIAWKYGTAPSLAAGIPVWVWMSLASCILLSILISGWKPGSGGARPENRARYVP
ncbi:MAG TPA: hypothetical protein VLH39_07525, partial [Magnetospirillaceae bacterium]|nr:hypothetical protein [Magnetospirillaceae bacterium]